MDVMNEKVILFSRTNSFAIVLNITQIALICNFHHFVARKGVEKGSGMSPLVSIGKDDLRLFGGR